MELENAIEAIENQVMPLARRLPRPMELIGVGPSIQAIACAAGAAGDVRGVLALDAVELLFQQLAAVSQGRPAASSGLPAGAAFAAGLLILREFMHHAGFGSVLVESEAESP